MQGALVAGMLVAAFIAVGCSGKATSSDGALPSARSGGSDPGAVTVESNAGIPAAFWQQGAMGDAWYFSVFPRQLGQQSCEIPHGGIAPQGADESRFPGVCSTSIGGLDSDSLAVVPESQRANALRTVVVSETWTGPASQGENKASWVFVVADDWRVLGTRIVGLPPQLWK